MTLLLAALGLGIAGIDPAGALIAVAALTAGAATRTVLGYGLVVLLGTAVWGTLLSLTVGQQLAGVDLARLLPADPVVAAIEGAAGVGALVWAVLRVVRPRRDQGARRPRRARLGGALLGIGALFTAGAALDPTFVGLVALAGRGDAWWLVVLAHLAWSLISQAPLLVLTVAVARGRHQAATAAITGWWERVAPRLRVLLTVLLAVLGLLLLVDVGWFVVTGGFLLPGP